MHCGFVRARFLGLCTCVVSDESVNDGSGTFWPFMIIILALNERVGV